MAVTVTRTNVSNDEVEWVVVATADADTVTTNQAHRLGFNPKIILVAMLQAPAALSSWALTTRDGTNWEATKATTVSSGNAGAQLRVHGQRRH